MMKISMEDNTTISPKLFISLINASNKNEIKRKLESNENLMIVLPIGITKYLNFAFLEQIKEISLDNFNIAKLDDEGILDGSNCVRVGRVIYLKVVNKGEKPDLDGIKSALCYLRDFCKNQDISQIILPYINIPYNNILDYYNWAFKFSRIIPCIFKLSKVQIFLHIGDKNIYDNWYAGEMNINKMNINNWNKFEKDDFYKKMEFFVKCPVCNEDEVINTVDPVGIRNFNHGIHIISISDTSIKCECLTCKTSYNVGIKVTDVYKLV